MSNYKIPSKIIGIQFSILSPEEIIRNSVIEVVSRDTYISNRPVSGGLFDPKMGVLEPGTICPTDGMTYIDTPGYFGHITLAKPVFFIQHLKEIVKICKCICLKCSKLLLVKKNHIHVLQYDNERRWDYVYSVASKIKRCDACGYLKPDKIKLEGMSSIIATWDSIVSDTKLLPERILSLFQHISDEDVHFLGFSPLWSRPDWFICQILPIAPPAVRPSVKVDAQQRSEDDLTHIYNAIIKLNNIILKQMDNGVSQNSIDINLDLLQHSIAMIAQNKIKGVAPMAQRSGRPLQCISGRLNSKNGRIRGNLMGKRVDFSARSVITGDPNLSIQQLGVPLKIAKNITKPVVVNDRNKQFLSLLVEAGPDNYPGAKIVERKNGAHIALRYIDRSNIQLHKGDIVHRHMLDDDICLFNRQPSLHRPSMMGHKVKVMMIGDSFRMNVAVTRPYNADFDGDEMNMHLSQNVVAEAELRHLAAVPYQIISPENNTPIIGIYQDSLLGSFRLTRGNVAIPVQFAMNLLMKYNNVDITQLQKDISPETNTITSFQLLSQILPKMSLTFKTSQYDDDIDNYETSNNVLQIQNGTLIRGQFDKSVLGSSTRSIIHRICNDYGNMACAKFNDDLQNIITDYMKVCSFSVGISDLIADKKTQTTILEIIDQQKNEVQKIIDKIHLGIFENNTVRSTAIEFELQVNNILNKATDLSGNVGRKSLDKNNRFLTIVASGSKGSALNISQMISCLGQQNVDGKRIVYGFDDRTLPHFCKYDDSPKARGFIENSYISGLSPHEVFFHAMGGRIGLIDTAVKTSQTGYVQRRLIKGLEDLKVEYDMTVRNNKNKIIQFQYGEDGMDPMKIENQHIALVEMTTKEIYEYYYMKNDPSFTSKTSLQFKKEVSELSTICLRYTEKMIQHRNDLIIHLFQFKNDNVVRTAVNFYHIINNIRGQLLIKDTNAIDITPYACFLLVENYFEKLRKMHYIPPTPLFEIMYFFHLTPKILLYTFHFHRDAIILLLETILMKYKESIIHPGEMVGIIAGQSVGAPTTQLTLNTFHNSGTSSKSNVTRGVPRIEEILRLTKKPKNPSMTIFMKDHYQTRENIDSCAKTLTFTRLADVVKSVQICFDPSDEETNITDDADMLRDFYQFEKLIQSSISDASTNDVQNKSKWIIRLQLEHIVLLEKNITMDDIHFVISNSQYKNDIQCTFTDYNNDKLIFRIRLKLSKSKKNQNTETFDQSDEISLLKTFQDQLLKNIILRGVPGIQNCQTRKCQNYLVWENIQYVTKDIWVIDTVGSNLLETFEFDFIDLTKITSNDIREICNVFGIEAARQSIYNELVEVMEFSGVYINYHHLSLLCDRMTCNQHMVPIFRSGLLNDDVGPIAKSTFEVHTDVLLKAARHAEFDHMRGISANIMTGQYGCYGTNAFQLIIDETLFYTSSSMKNKKEEENEKAEEDKDKDKYKDKDKAGKDKDKAGKTGKAGKAEEREREGEGEGEGEREREGEGEKEGEGEEEEKGKRDEEEKANYEAVQSMTELLTRKNEFYFPLQDTCVHTTLLDPSAYFLDTKNDTKYDVGF